MNKKLIYISVVVLVIVAVLVVMWPSIATQPEAEFKTNEDSIISNDDLVGLIQNYDSLTDFNQQITVWREMFKACPFWVAFITKSFNSGMYNDAREFGMTLDDMFTDFAIRNIENGEDILLMQSKCNNSTADLDAIFDLGNLRY